MQEDHTHRSIDSDDQMLIALAAATLLIHLLCNRGYGYFRDEFTLSPVASTSLGDMSTSRRSPNLSSLFRAACWVIRYLRCGCCRRCVAPVWHSS